METIQPSELRAKGVNLSRRKRLLKNQRLSKPSTNPNKKIKPLNELNLPNSTNFISLELMECLESLKQVRAKLETYYISNKIIQENIFDYLCDVDTDIVNAADGIGKMTTVELLENFFYSEVEAYPLCFVCNK